ncbi:unnamed protein product [Cylicocyclus nassatus]|uniref:Uncharacterized protein n=1 Tax=Cylicocyclus nassatus TaxID=53992 RepID=A0AA36HHY7_CYLNA|nr:unnamed protein product [Cylicocyclus nassatus]
MIESEVMNARIRPGCCSTYAQQPRTHRSNDTIDASFIHYLENPEIPQLSRSLMSMWKRPNLIRNSAEETRRFTAAKSALRSKASSEGLKTTR